MHEHSTEIIDVNVPSHCILPFYEVFYIDSMLINTQSAVVSWQRVSECIHRLANTDNSHALADIESKEILDSLQNVITRAAALSRYFWPAQDGKNKVHMKRAEQLRQAFSVTDESSLKDRELRNCIEHFDERLDHYLSRLIIGQIIPSYVGNAPKNCGVPQYIFRAYYADIGTFVILDAQYQIKPIVDEIFRLHSILGQCTIEGCRLPLGGLHA